MGLTTEYGHVIKSCETAEIWCYMLVWDVF